jgi:hypothetical protein
LIAAVPERTATRDALVREVADRLDLPVDYVTAAPARPEAPRAGLAATPAAAPSAPSAGGVWLAAERAFLAMCLASEQAGREHLERLSADHLSSDLTRRAREHLVARFDDPLVGLPEDDPALAALVTGVAMAAEEQGEATEPMLRMSFLQLEQRRIDRELRQAAEAADRGRQDELAEARQDVRREMDAVMGQMA